jgi:succinate dehydrogenase / fumarate reductase membrane anchor subunit
MGDFRTPLARVRGLGAAGEGTGHFWKIRITSVALVPLTLFFLGLLIALTGADYAEVRDVLASPLVAVTMIVVMLVSVYHMHLGMQDIILDYVHSDGAKFTLLVVNTFFCVAVGAATVFALLKLTFGG